MRATWRTIARSRTRGVILQLCAQCAGVSLPLGATDFADRHGFALDWVYVATMMNGILAMAEQGAFTPRLPPW
jgi:hypothetical protein